ncbi:amino acid ABC transporter permease [Nocardioides eburneiflavus]|uniref:Amino acid ABC transporter permease n=2 Tax=Nocardioides eburneiflavus TaxID=2518372 RepID=A0A4Z1CPH1_9ACTN|nr:amino acid ABC transporter permease [Nocardioides eburneiflavus]TGN66882.1 amino acid ABC transporter permease [Nocardioides eburneiflavus]
MLETLGEDKPRLRLRRPVDYLSWVLTVGLLAGLAYTLVTNENYRWPVVLEYFTAASIISGIGITLILTITSMVLGILLGLVLAIMRASSQPPVSALARLYITFFRGTPVLVQLIFWFNLAALYPRLSIGVPGTDISMPVNVNQLLSPMTAAIIGLTLNQAAYMAEIIRGGFAAVGRGQLEAAESLGMHGFTKLRIVVIPQTMPSIIPPTGNQFIGMLKETSLVSVLGVADLLQSAQSIYARTYETIPLLIVASLWYLIMTMTLSVPQSMIERHFSRSTRVPRSSRSATGTAARPVLEVAPKESLL